MAFTDLQLHDFNITGDVKLTEEALYLFNPASKRIYENHSHRSNIPTTEY